MVERLTDAGVDVNVDEDGEDGLAVDVDVLNEAEGVREVEEAHESVGVVLPSQVVWHWASQSQCHLFLPYGSNQWAFQRLQPGVKCSCPPGQ